MCGRYYVDDETAKEIEKIVRSVDEKLKKEAAQSSQLQTKDIHPTECAPVLVVSAGGLRCELKKWGFPGFMDKQLVINARSESAMEKKMFRESVLKRRLIIPASGSTHRIQKPV